jgi:hypothetical protein
MNLTSIPDVQPDLNDADGNTLPPKLESLADQIWKYIESRHMKVHDAKLLQKMLEAGQAPPPALENAILGGGDDMDDADGMDDDFEDEDFEDEDFEDEEDDFEPDEFSEDDGEEDLDSDDDSDEDSEEEEDSELDDDDDAEYGDDMGSDMKEGKKEADVKLYEKRIKELEEKDLKRDEEHKAMLAKSRFLEAKTIVSEKVKLYSLSDAQVNDLAEVVAKVDEADKAKLLGVVDALAAGVESEKPVKPIGNLGAVLYEGKTGPKPKEKVDYTAVGRISHEKGISWDEAVALWKAGK